VTSDSDLLPADWYVVQTKPKQEFRALEQLQNQHYHCFLPTLQIKKIRRGKLTVETEPLFSRYLFIRLDSVTTDWSPIRSTRGVSNLVAFGGRFATLPHAYIAALQNGPPNYVPQNLFDPGEPVTINDGPFAGFEGLYQLPDGEARAFVLIELMRQPQKLSFALETLRKAS
jgi:transcriptional antiterminator RfaH